MDILFMHYAMDDGLYKKRLKRGKKPIYTTWNMIKYRQLADKIITLIKRAKAEYFSSIKVA